MPKDSGESHMEIELNEDFKDLLRSLNSKNVKYMIIGGYAVISHGHPRLTNDLDVAVANETENIERCLDALRDFGFTGPGITAALFSKPKSVVRMGVEPVKIEILNFLEGVDFAAAYERRETRPTEDIQFDLISLEDLIINKTAVGRDKDILDVKELLKVSGKE